MNLYVVRYTDIDEEWEIESIHKTEYGARVRMEKIKKENCETTQYRIDSYRLQE